MYIYLNRKRVFIVVVAVLAISVLAYSFSVLISNIQTGEVLSTTFMDEEGNTISPTCESTCKQWLTGSCTFDKQYYERSCTCNGSGELFYEVKIESANCRV